MSAELTKEIKRLSNLVQNKGLSSDELIPIARINILVREFHKEGMFIDLDEQKNAENCYREYLTNNEIENASDIDTLKSLVYNQIFEIRIQKELNNLQKLGKCPPDKLTKQLVDIQEQKTKIKIRLGIDKKEDEKDDLSALQLHQKRVDKYINEHKNEFSFNLGFQCEECGHKNWDSFLLYKRIKDFDSSIKHPWFLGRWLFNYPIIKDVKDKKLSPEDATRYLMGAGEGKFFQPSDVDKKWCVDYVNYLVENWTEIIDLMNKK